MTGKISMKNPHRWAVKHLRELDVRPATRLSYGQMFRAPDGAEFMVNDRLEQGAAIALLARVRSHLGIPGPVQGAEQVKPSLTRGQVRFSGHARDRWELMREQAAVAVVELEACLFHPGEVIYSEKHKTWLFITARLKVAVVFRDGELPAVTTIMWSREELFAANPRPVKP